jgi:hypothetical protein
MPTELITTHRTSTVEPTERFLTSAVADLDPKVAETLRKRLSARQRVSGDAIESISTEEARRVLSRTDLYRFFEVTSTLNKLSENTQRSLFGAGLIVSGAIASGAFLSHVGGVDIGMKSVLALLDVGLTAAGLGALVMANDALGNTIRKTAAQRLRSLPVAEQS